MSPQDGKILNNLLPMSGTKHVTIMRTSSMKNSNDYQPERDRRAGIRQDLWACRGSEGGTGIISAQPLSHFHSCSEKQDDY